MSKSGSTSEENLHRNDDDPTDNGVGSDAP